MKQEEGLSKKQVSIVAFTVAIKVIDCLIGKSVEPWTWEITRYGDTWVETGRSLPYLTVIKQVS